MLLVVGAAVSWQVSRSRISKKASTPPPPPIDPVAAPPPQPAKVDATSKEGGEEGDEAEAEAAHCGVGGSCATAANCKGLECAASSEECFKAPCFQGIRPSTDAVQVRLRNPAKIVFSYPFHSSRLRLQDGHFLAADPNHIRTVAGSQHRCEFWSFDGRHLINDDTGMCIRKLNDYEVVMDRPTGREDQQWLFDGQRFYAMSSLKHGRYLFLSYDDDKYHLPFIKEGTANDLYRTGKHPLVVEGFTAPYAY